MAFMQITDRFGSLAGFIQDMRDPTEQVTDEQMNCGKRGFQGTGLDCVPTVLLWVRHREGQVPVSLAPQTCTHTHTCHSTWTIAQRA